MISECFPVYAFTQSLCHDHDLTHDHFFKLCKGGLNSVVFPWLVFIIDGDENKDCLGIVDEIFFTGPPTWFGREGATHVACFGRNSLAEHILLQFSDLNSEFSFF